MLYTTHTNKRLRERERVSKIFQNITVVGTRQHFIKVFSTGVRFELSPRLNRIHNFFFLINKKKKKIILVYLSLTKKKKLISKVRFFFLLRSAKKTFLPWSLTGHKFLIENEIKT